MNNLSKQEYQEELFKLDGLIGDGIFAIPSKEEEKYDWITLKSYVKEKYNNDVSKMTQEEWDRFIIKEEHRKTA